MLVRCGGIVSANKPEAINPGDWPLKMRSIVISVFKDVTRDHATRCHDMCPIFVVADGESCGLFF
tara:strand:- start:395 stop:589 length:195 start_codon:yes stop_codon:yes gene_type:complete